MRSTAAAFGSGDGVKPSPRERAATSAPPIPTTLIASPDRRKANGEDRRKASSADRLEGSTSGASSPT